MNGWDSDRFHEPGCADPGCRGCKPPTTNPVRDAGMFTSLDAARKALAELARKFDEIAAAHGRMAACVRGMQHAAERARNAANEHNDPEDPEAWWQQHLAAASQRADGHQD